jgi:amino acid adenylation domain-containing protein
MSRKYFSLASNQKDIWFDQLAYPDTAVYNIGGYLIISGEVNIALLESSIEQLVAESDAFRLLFRVEADKPVQIIDENIKGQLTFIDYSDSFQAEDLSLNYLTEQFSIAFDINSVKPLWQFVLVKEHSDKYYLLTKYHHLISDGWTTKIVIERLAELYNSLLDSENTISDTAVSDNQPVSYRNFIAQEKKYLASEKYEQDKDYWFQQFNYLPDNLIEHRYRSENDHGLAEALVHRFMIKREDYDRFELFAKGQKSSTYHLFLTMLSVYFARIYQRDEIVIGLPGLNRSGARFKQVPGMFINILPFAVKIDHKQSLVNTLQQCTRQLRSHYRHQKFPLSEINRHLSILKQGRNSLFDIVLSYERQNYSDSYGKAEIYAHQLFSGIARFPLGVTICEFHDNEAVEIILEGARDCFNREDLDLLACRIQSLIVQLIELPELSIDNVDLLSRKDKKILHKTFFSPQLKEVQSSETSTDLLSCYYQQLNTQDEHPAVQLEEHSLSWLELEQQSNILAEFILEQGVKEGSIVAICLPRCCEMIVSMLAVLKSGAAWLPVAPDHPADRIFQLYDTCGAKLLLTTASLQGRLEKIISDKEQLIAVDCYIKTSSNLVSDKIYTRRSDSLCYVIYTSGSSGQPKGVMVDYAALSLRMDWIRNHFGIFSDDNIAQSIAFNFDPALIEIFLSLTTGATLKLLPDHAIEPGLLADFVCREKIHFMALVPSSLSNLTIGLAKNQSLCSLKTLCCGGEVLSTELVRQFYTSVTESCSVSLFNVYGPTEAVIFSTAWLCQDIEHYPVLPLGQSISDVSTIVVDSQRKQLPPGVIGEIAITGPVLSRGYINQTDETEKVFFDNSSDEIVNEKIYLTGDIGYIANDGLL